LLSGDLRDDTKPAFVRVYHQALAVVCDSLFFAHHGRPSDTVRSVAAAMGTDPRSAGQALQSLFGQSPNEDSSTRIVEDLLDIKVLPEVDAHGKQFTPDRVQERSVTTTMMMMTTMRMMRMMIRILMRMMMRMMMMMTTTTMTTMTTTTTATQVIYILVLFTFPWTLQAIQVQQLLNTRQAAGHAG
jgi:hypothetical protein